MPHPTTDHAAMNIWTHQHVDLARRMHALGLEAPLAPGTYVVADGGAPAGPPSPLAAGFHLIVWPDAFVEQVGGLAAFRRHYAWLPTWEQGFAWLVAQGVGAKHIYYVVKEGVMFYDEDERSLLYGEMERILTIEAARRGTPPDAAT